MPKVIGFSISEENFPGADVSADEWEFLRAVERYQKLYERRYPSWREVFRVLLSLGYRKVAAPTAWPAKPELVRGNRNGPKPRPGDEAPGERSA